MFEGTRGAGAGAGTGARGAGAPGRDPSDVRGLPAPNRRGAPPSIQRRS